MYFYSRLSDSQKTMQHSHKAGSLKQVNKTHKQSKASKRSIKLKQGGRVETAEKIIIKDKYLWSFHFTQ